MTRTLGLYVLAPALLLLTLTVAVQIPESPHVGLKVRNLLVVSVDPGGPAEAAGLRPGDRVRSLQDRPLRSMAEWFAGLAAIRARPGAEEPAPASPRQLRLTVLRGQQQLTATVVPTAPPRARIVWLYGLWVAGLSFLLIGWWVLWRRNDHVARTFFGLGLVFCFFLADVPDWPSAAAMTAKEILRDLLQLLWPVLFLRFFLVFPAPAASVLPASRLRRDRLLLLPAAPLAALTLWAQLVRADPASAAVRVLQTATFFYFLFYFLAGLWVFARKVLRRDRPVQQTRLRLVLFGLVGGLAPFLVGVILGSAFPSAPFGHWEYLGFSLLLVPASLGLAILRYGALDTAYVVRSGLLWASLTVLVLAIYVGLVGVAGHLLTRLFGVSTYPLVLLAVAGSALLVLPARRALQDWIDRTFYPRRRAGRAALAALGQELSGELDGRAAATTLLSRLAGIYDPERLSLFVRAPGAPAFREEAACGPRGPLPTVFSLPAAGELARFLDRARRPVFAEDFEVARQEGLLPPPEPEDGDADGEGGAEGTGGGTLRAATVPAGGPAMASAAPATASPPAKASGAVVAGPAAPSSSLGLATLVAARAAAEEDGAGFLQRLGCELLVPLVTGGRLVGFLAFGPKSGGDLYAQDDLANLHQLAVQVAALLESRRLYAEILQRRQLETELEVARGIQAQLLPTGPLRLPGVELQGVTRSCREVGGDYFDYFPLDARTVGLAIADVAGKGIPAALLMSSLRVTFRGEAPRERRPERVIEQLNRAVCDLGGTLVAFFYGVYDPRERVLLYCNAGLEPPLLLRPGRAWRDDLARGGPMLGADPDRRYRAGTVALAPRDLLVCYTDGLTEQAGPDGEFFGRDRLLAAASAARDLPSAALIDRLLAAVDAHGAEPSDDRTVLLLRVPAGEPARERHPAEADDGQSAAPSAGEVASGPRARAGI